MGYLPADGSRHPCEIRVGPRTECCMLYDICIPPRSFTALEQLGEGKSLVFHAVQAPCGMLSLVLNEMVIGIGQRDHFLVRPGQTYCVRNDSETDHSRLKMV